MFGPEKAVRCFPNLQKSNPKKNFLTGKHFFETLLDSRVLDSAQ